MTSDVELADFLTGALTEAGWPVHDLWATADKDGLFHFGAFGQAPPAAVRWKAATLAIIAFPGLEGHVCWPCYREQPGPRHSPCPHDWRTAPQPSREELRASA